MLKFAVETIISLSLLGGVNMDFLGAGGIWTLLLVCAVIGVLLITAAKLIK